MWVEVIKKYRPEIGDLVIRENVLLGKIVNISKKFRQSYVKILKCHIKERIGEKVPIMNSELKLVWREQK